MAARDTKTGSVHEQMVIQALNSSDYSYSAQKYIGNRPGGRKHKIDIIIDQTLVSLKWQQVGGTAEQKIPFEVICLSEAIRQNNELYKKAYLVLGGEGWTLRDFYVGGGLNKHLTYSHLVEITTMERFISLINSYKL